MKTSNETRWWDLPAASLLMVAMLTAATRLVVTKWTDYLSIIQTVVFLGTLAGLALGQSRFSRKIVFFFGLAYGLFVVPWQIGQTLGRDILWSQRLYIIADRLEIIINQLVNQEVVQDSLLFVVLMAILFWALSVQAGYSLTRNANAWRAILPIGLTIFVIHSFDPLIARRAWYLAIYLFFGLVLVARMAYLYQHNRWQESRTALPPHLGLDFIRFTLAATTLLVLLAWSAPALANSLPVAEQAFQRIKQPWNEIRDKWDNAFASLRSSVGIVSDYYGSSVLLGRGNRLTDDPVFAVTPPPSTPEGVRYYWRARFYDTYVGGQWISTAPNSRRFEPEAFDLTFPDENLRWISDFEFTTAAPVSTIFSPAQPIWISRPSQIETFINPDGTVDVSSFRATPVINAGDTYQARASISNVTIAQLREAGTDYPDWIRERYLQLPANITPRTRQLAFDLTVGLNTPYDKTIAITNYLRDNIKYSETVPNQPARQETVDWFLFDHKEGFCNYYATAEVVLLRMLGIPARWAGGFAQGDQLEDGTFIVRQRDAHAWPEVYFPGVGWVEFEPTSAQPAITRLPGTASENESAISPPLVNDDEERRRLMEEQLALRADRLRDPSAGAQNSGNLLDRISLWWLIPFAAGLALFAFVWKHKDRINLATTPIVIELTMLKLGLRPPQALRHWARRAALPPLTKAYLEINQALKRLGNQPTATETPAERAFALVDILPPAREPAERLVTEYELATFSPQPANLPAARNAGGQIRSLSYKAKLKRFFARFQQPVKPSRSWQPRRR